MSEDDAGAHSFDFAMAYRENGIGFKYVRVSNMARFRVDEELAKAILAEAAKFADGVELKKKLGKKVSAIEMKAILAGKNAAATGAAAAGKLQADNLDDL